MSPAQKAYHILRCFGPRFVAQRLGIAVRKRLGVTQRVFRSRPWGAIALADVVRPGVPTDPAEYARFREQSPPPFFFPLGRPPELPARLKNAPADRQPNLASRIEALREMRCTYFFRTLSPTPIDWYANPIDGMRSRPGVPWFEIPDYLHDQGDPRMMWEPGRAAWAIDLARAPSHGLAADAGELLWRWIDSWMSACPPYDGFQWKCGQESSVRLIALALGIWSHGLPPTMTPDRWQRFARIAWATGYRVDHHIDYAISQKNNHAISEAVGLMLVAHLFPEFRDSPRWWSRGRDVLATELRRQTYADGSYVQSSLNYERVMLHGALIGLRLAELANQPFDRDIYDLLGRCGDFMLQLTDARTGAGPNTGNNDGAWILPLSECDFTDFRPVIQSVYYLVNRRPLLPAGPWDEDLLWLFENDAADVSSLSGRASDSTAPEENPSRPEISANATRTSSAFQAGGYYTLRTPESWAMIRCHTFQDRPAHCDQLHLDLWWNGLNVLTDAGTYHYYIPGRPDIEHYFKGVRSHNTVEIDERDPLELVSRFMWLPWPRARLLRFDAGAGGPPRFEGESLDYDRDLSRVLHRRAVLALAPNAWVVVDDLLGEGAHAATLRWHMQDFSARLLDPMTVVHETPLGPLSIALASEQAGRSAGPAVEANGRRDSETAPGGGPSMSPSDPENRRYVSVGATLVRARDDKDRVQGWISPYYGERLPAVTLEVSVRGGFPFRIVSLMTLGVPGEVALADDARTCTVRAGDAVSRIRLGAPDRRAASVIEKWERSSSADRLLLPGPGDGYPRTDAVPVSNR